MGQGTVKWYDANKGFGFIEREGAPDLWFHSRDRSDGVDEAQFVPGTWIEFEVGHSARGQKGSITRIMQGAGMPAAVPAVPETPQYTLDEAFKGLREAELAVVEWTDIVESLCQAGRA